MSTASDLLRECLHHLVLHNEEYSHRTPEDLIKRVQDYLADAPRAWNERRCQKCGGLMQGFYVNHQPNCPDVPL